MEELIKASHTVVDHRKKGDLTETIRLLEEVLLNIAWKD
jgi:hypothetical protein